jgi:hypothetical protein
MPSNTARPPPAGRSDRPPGRSHDEITAIREAVTAIHAEVAARKTEPQPAASTPSTRSEPVRALPRLAMIALGFTLHPPSPAAIGLLFLVALLWPCGPAPHPRPARHGWRGRRALRAIA